MLKAIWFTGLLIYFIYLELKKEKKNDNAPFQRSPKMTAARKTVPEFNIETKLPDHKLHTDKYDLPQSRFYNCVVYVKY